MTTTDVEYTIACCQSAMRRNLREFLIEHKHRYMDSSPRTNAIEQAAAMGVIRFTALCGTISTQQASALYAWVQGWGE